MVIVPDPPTLKVGKLGFPLLDALEQVEEALLSAVKRVIDSTILPFICESSRPGTMARCEK